MTPAMMSRAEVRRSLLAMGVHPREVESIVEGLPRAGRSRAPRGRASGRLDAADQAAARVLADCERLLDGDDS
jgi:hypothetical protein